MFSLWVFVCHVFPIPWKGLFPSMSFWNITSTAAVNEAWKLWPTLKAVRCDHGKRFLSFRKVYFAHLGRIARKSLCFENRLWGKTDFGKRPSNFRKLWKPEKLPSFPSFTRGCLGIIYLLQLQTLLLKSLHCVSLGGLLTKEELLHLRLRQTH